MQSCKCSWIAFNSEAFILCWSLLLVLLYKQFICVILFFIIKGSRSEGRWTPGHPQLSPHYSWGKSKLSNFASNKVLNKIFPPTTRCPWSNGGGVGSIGSTIARKYQQQVNDLRTLFNSVVKFFSRAGFDSFLFDSLSCRMKEQMAKLCLYRTVVLQVIFFLFCLLNKTMLSKYGFKNKDVNKLKAKCANVIGHKCWLPLE